ncbi:MAG: hypothetical protein U0353_28730 [Sandaracinus sp.]
MKEPLTRAVRLLADTKVEGEQVIGRLRGHDVRFGLYADGHDEPEEVWAAYVLTDTGALDCAVFFGDAANRVETGDASFDAEVALTSNLPEAARRLVDASLRARVRELRCRLDCCQGVRVAKYRHRTAEHDVPVDQLLALAVNAAERIQGLVAEGVIPRAPLPPLRPQMKREPMTSALPFVALAIVLLVVLGAGAAALHFFG